MEVAYYLPYIKKEQQALSQLIKKYFSKNDFRNPRIFDFCCGVVNEEPLLLKYFGKNSEIISIDNNLSIEELSRQLGRKSFRFGDLKNIDKYIRGKFDLVIGRNIPVNPNWREFDEPCHEDIWPNFFSKLPNYMKDNS